MLFYLGRQRALDADVQASPGALANFYVTGTSNRQDTWQNAALTIPHANPVAADDYGLWPPIYLDPALTYKVIITDRDGAALPDGTIDPLVQAAFSQAQIGALLYPQSDAEDAGSAPPVNTIYPYGNLLRYYAGSGSIAAAWAAANAQSAAGGAPIFVPRVDGGFETDAALTVDYRSDVIFEPGAFIKYTGSSNIVVLTIGTAGQVAFSRRYERLWVTRTNQADWTSESAVGIRFLAVAGSYIDIVESSKHTIGVQTLPAGGSGFQGNQIFLGHLYGNKYQLDISNATAGFSNDNTWYAGRFQLFTGTNDTLSRFGIRITSSDATYTNNNANRFLGPLIELNASAASAEAVAIWINHGEDNHFLDVRSEGNDLTLRTSNDSIRNVVQLGYDDSTTTRIEQLGTSSENIAIGMRKRPNSYYTNPLFEITDLGRRARGVSGTSILVEGLLWGTSGSASRTAVSSTSVTYDGNYITIGTTRCMGLFINTAICKEFVVRRSGTAGGRMRVTAYDAADGGGSVLSAAGSVLGTRATPLTYDGTLFGGSWGPGSDFLTDFYFRVSTATLSVFVLVTGGDASAVLSSFGVYAQTNQDGVRAFTGAYTSPGEITGGAYTPTNVTPDRAFDADTVAVAELADVVGTLIADLQTLRILR